MWIEVTEYPIEHKYLVNIDQIVLIKQLSEDCSVIALSSGEDDFIKVKETYEEIKTMLLDSKKEKGN